MNFFLQIMERDSSVRAGEHPALKWSSSTSKKPMGVIPRAGQRTPTAESNSSLELRKQPREYYYPHPAHSLSHRAGIYNAALCKHATESGGIHQSKCGTSRWAHFAVQPREMCLFRGVYSPPKIDICVLTQNTPSGAHSALLTVKGAQGLSWDGNTHSGDVRLRPNECSLLQL